MDGHLWSEAFTERAKAIAHCRNCLGEMHSQFLMWNVLKPWKLVCYQPNLPVDTVSRKAGCPLARFATCLMIPREKGVRISHASSSMLFLSVEVITQLLTQEELPLPYESSSQALIKGLDTRVDSNNSAVFSFMCRIHSFPADHHNLK